MRRPSVWCLAFAMPLLACVPSQDDEQTVTLGVATGPSDESSVDPDSCYMDGAQCDPLAPQCSGTSQCVSLGNDFQCQTPTVGAQQAGSGQPCEGAISCQAGLVCMPVSVSGCTGSFGCCISLCDLESPQCGGSETCTPLFSDPPPVCFGLVGVCIEA